MNTFSNLTAPMGSSGIDWSFSFDDAVPKKLQHLFNSSCKLFGHVSIALSCVLAVNFLNSKFCQNCVFPLFWEDFIDKREKWYVEMKNMISKLDLGIIVMSVILSKPRRFLGSQGCEFSILCFDWIPIEQPLYKPNTF